MCCELQELRMFALRAASLEGIELELNIHLGHSAPFTAVCRQVATFPKCASFNRRAALRLCQCHMQETC